MHAAVEVRLPDGSTVELVPGDLLGRHWSCAAWLADPRISEAHAMVSLRGPALKLLALRGRFSLGEGALTELDLAPGQVIFLAQHLSIEVLRVFAPEHSLAIQGPALPRQLLAGVVSLTVSPRPRLRRGTQPDADAILFSDGEDWRLRQAATETILQPDTTVHIGEFPLRVVQVAHGKQAAATQLDGRLASPLHIEVRTETVHISRDNTVILRLVGTPARLLTELALMNAPSPWRAVAREVWPATHSDHRLRTRFDNCLMRLRRSLRTHGVRPDLVKADGKGSYELFLHPTDQVIDSA